jgi:hypothetical protein
MESSAGGRAFMSRNAGRGERRVLSATLPRMIRNCVNCLLASFLCLSIYGWSQDQSNPPAQPTQTSPQTAPQNPPPADQQNPPAENPPPENKDTNPAQAVADKTKEVTVQAVQTTKAAAQQGLVQLRDWEEGWFTGAFVPKDRTPKPLTAEQRRRIYLTETLTRPGDYFKRAFAAGIDQARGSPYQWGGGVEGYADRFASREGQFITANSLSALANAGLGYDPRYDQCHCSGLWPRMRHAIWRNFVTYDSSEQHLRPQLGLYAGAFSGGVISAAWKPAPRNAVTEGTRAALEQGGYGALLNIFIEFAGEINKKLGSKK